MRANFKREIGIATVASIVFLLSAIISSIVGIQNYKLNKQKLAEMEEKS